MVQKKINSVEFRCNWTMFCNWPIFQMRKLRLPHRKLFALLALKKRKWEQKKGNMVKC